MIYTLTLCPALDLYINNNLKTNYCLTGGKGINVSRLLKTLKTNSVCLGFVGGKTGKFIINDLNKNKIKNDFVITKNPTRINMKITSDCETEINGKPQPISKKEYQLLKAKLLKLTNKDILIASGSLPKDLDIKWAKQILSTLYKKGVKFVFDTSSKYLINLCKYKPLLVKPNKEELSNIFNVQIKTDKQIILYAKKLLNLGAQNVVVSLGKDGAILVNKNCVIKQKAPKVKLVSSIGCGDSMVAGFVYKYFKTKDYKDILAYSVACGSATAISKSLGTLNNIIILFKDIK